MTEDFNHASYTHHSTHDEQNQSARKSSLATLKSTPAIKELSDFLATGGI